MSRQVMFTQQVVAANKEAVEGGFNRALTDEFVEQLDPDGVHLVVFSMIHSHKQGIKVEPHVRVEAMFKMRDSMEPQRAFLDMSLERFNALANADDLTAAS